MPFVMKVVLVHNMKFENHLLVSLRINVQKVYPVELTLGYALELYQFSEHFERKSAQVKFE
jgi:hypothetical protein